MLLIVVYSPYHARTISVIHKKHYLVYIEEERLQYVHALIIFFSLPN